LNVLPAVARAYLGALDFGKWILAYIDRNMKEEGFTVNASLHTSIIDMYSKCGSRDMAEQVFNALETQSFSSWNAMIAGLVMHGLTDKAMTYFERVKKEGLKPDEITFLGVLSACSHAGWVETANLYFDSMV